MLKLCYTTLGRVMEYHSCWSDDSYGVNLYITLTNDTYLNTYLNVNTLKIGIPLLME